MKGSHNIFSRLAISGKHQPSSLDGQMVEPKNYIKNIVKFEC